VLGLDVGVPFVVYERWAAEMEKAPVQTPSPLLQKTFVLASGRQPHPPRYLVLSPAL
jgi:hypothetical protein